MILGKKDNPHPTLLLLMLLHTTILVRSSHHTELMEVTSAHHRDRAVEVRSIVTSQAGWDAREKTMPTFFLRRTLFSSLYAASFVLQCEETPGYGENTTWGNIWKKVRTVKCR